MITTKSKLPVGAVFYLLHNPGNAYHNLHKGKAEFIEHRLGSQYRGYQVELGVNQMVATDPLDKLLDPCVLCGKPSEDFLEGLCLDCSCGEAEHYDLL